MAKPQPLQRAPRQKAGAADISPTPVFDIYGTPGHLIRRAQQIVVSLFLEQTGGLITPVQYGVLAILQSQGELDQVSLSQRLALDTSTSGSILERMEKKGWVDRKVDPGDRRRRVVGLTPAGLDLLVSLREEVETIQHRLLEPLESGERAVFMRLLGTLVHLHNDVSRAPLRMD